jgi:hypothetical protein
MGSYTGRAGTRASAAAAAFERAVECRSRRAELEAGAHVSGFDYVSLAQQRLADAIERARAAEQRLGDLRDRNHIHRALRRAGFPLAHQPAALPSQLVRESADTSLARELLGWVEDGSVVVHDLWLGFLAYGGEVSFLEFDGYLHGAWSMSERDRHVLDQVCWEHSRFCDPMP